MITGDPIPGRVPDQVSTAEVPFARPIQEITRDFFVAIGDPEEERNRKQAQGFCIVENPRVPVARTAEVLSGRYRGAIKMGVEKSSFEELVGLIATDQPVVEMSGFSDQQLRRMLYRGAQETLSANKNFIADSQLFGDQAQHGIFPAAHSIEEAEARIAGLEQFQSNLLERAQDR